MLEKAIVKGLKLLTTVFIRRLVFFPALNLKSKVLESTINL